jgi:serine/threonine protein kinase
MGDLERAALTGQLKRADGAPDEFKILCLLRDVAAGLAYLHTQNILHADLKVAAAPGSPGPPRRAAQRGQRLTCQHGAPAGRPARVPTLRAPPLPLSRPQAGNVLLASNASSPVGMTAKISDFGLSRALGAGQTHQSTRTVGTVTHVPPELLLSGKLSAKADVYALGEGPSPCLLACSRPASDAPARAHPPAPRRPPLPASQPPHAHPQPAPPPAPPPLAPAAGMLMWEAWSGEHAFGRLNFAEVFAQVVVHQARPPVPPDMPPPLALLMTACWDHDPAARPDVSACLHCIEGRIAVVAQRGSGAGGAGGATAAAAAAAPALPQGALAAAGAAADAGAAPPAPDNV